MPFKDPNNLSLLEIVVFGGFAAIGGLLAYVLRVLNNDEKPTWGRAVLEALSSGFVGLIAMLACKALGLDWKWSGVIVGVFGWLGAEASIAILAKLIRGKLGIDPSYLKDEPTPPTAAPEAKPEYQPKEEKDGNS